jgi:hypothetical protein
MTNAQLLEEIVIISRKYDLAEKSDFVTKIQKLISVKHSMIESIWDISSRKVKNDDIIKDAKELKEEYAALIEVHAQEIISGRLGVVRSLLYLAFDPKEFKLIEEKKIRRLRNKVARGYLKILYETYEKNIEKNKEDYKRKLKKNSFIGSILIILVGLAVIIPFFNNYLIYKKNLSNWRSNGIANSPTVCITRTGKRYHNCYHYSDRNYEVSLFVAMIDMHKDACGTCNPPIIDFGKKPTSKTPNLYVLVAFFIFGGFLGISSYNSYLDKKLKIQNVLKSLH